MTIQLWLPFPRLEEPAHERTPRRRPPRPPHHQQLPLLLHDLSILYAPLTPRRSPCRAELEG